MTPSKLTEGFKRDYYNMNLVPVLRGKICSPITCTRKKLPESSQQQVFQTSRLDLSSTVCVTGQIISRAFMPHVAEEFVSSIIGRSPRSTNSALMLQFQEQKGEHV